MALCLTLLVTVVAVGLSEGMKAGDDGTTRQELFWDKDGNFHTPTKAECAQLVRSLDGQRLLVVGYLDEQLISGSRALSNIMDIARKANRTFVEMMTGPAWESPMFHKTRSGSKSLNFTAYTRLGALYDLESVRSQGLRIMPIEEYWRLDLCGHVSTEIIGSTYHKSVVHSLQPSREGNNDCSVFSNDSTNELRVPRSFCKGTNYSNEIASTAPIVEICCYHKDLTVDSNITLEFNEPVRLARQFMLKHNLTDGFLAIHWRSEKDIGHLAKEMEETGSLEKTVGTRITRFRGILTDPVRHLYEQKEKYMNVLHSAIDNFNLKKHIPVYLAVDFVHGGTNSLRENALYTTKLHDALVDVHDTIASVFRVISYNAQKENPELVSSRSDMMIAATEALILAHSTKFIPMVKSSSFVRFVQHHRLKIHGAEIDESFAVQS